MSKSYPLGRLPSKDTRDSNFLMKSIIKIPRTGILPTSKMWVPGPILDQGQYPHCVGYAWKQFLAASPIRTKGGQSADTIYYTAQTMDEWPGENYDGTSVRGGAKAVKSFGRLSSYYWAYSTEDIKSFILTSGTVVVGTNWYEQMFEPAKSGFIKPEGYIAGGHAWLIIGYSTSKKAFRAVNSWGRNWGQNGRFWITQEDLEKLLNEDGEACTAIEKEL